MPLEDFHSLNLNEVRQKLDLDTGQEGLSQREVELRLKKYGPNQLPEREGRSLLQMLWDQLSSLMILILFVAAGISGFLHDLTDSMVILAIIVVNAVIGLIQDFQAQKALAALKKILPARARVLRDQVWQTLSADQLVPGDWVEVEAGDAIPADIRVSKAHLLAADESALTGESVPVEKRDDFIAEPKASVGDRKNLLHKGTLISRGRGQGIVVRTGLNTELGQIALLLETAEQVQTPLQKRLDQFSRKLTWFLLLICLLLFGVGILHGQDWLSMLMTAVSLAVAAIPEALPSVIVIALAVGAKRMVSRRALIQKLSAVEALGSTTVICSDKTGTLTQNKMTVVRSWIPHPEREELFYTNLALNNDVRWQDRTRQLAEGEPTEKALFLHAYHHGKDKEELGHTWPRVNEFPFDPKEKLMVTQHQQPDATFYFLKGAPEVVLQLCQDDTSVTNGTQHAMQMAEGGLRVLAFAWFQSSSPIANLDLDYIHSAKWELLGFAGMIDPPRPEVKQAIQDCLTAGIRVQMITGDHPRTALAIARELKIEGDGLTGEELEKISPESLALRIGQIGVFARTAPKQKIRIVQALQAQGEMVAMTGDGVNDAPALKQAHIGVAMGKIGTDVAREASAMVLLDDNFATIVAAIREGRRIFDNLRKFLVFVLAGNLGEILTISIALFVGLPPPLLPVQILWVNLITDGLPGLSMSLLEEEPGVMTRPPIPSQQNILSKALLREILIGGILVASASLMAFYFGLKESALTARTMGFTTLSLCQLFMAWAISSSQPLGRGFRFYSPTLLAALAICGLLQIMAVEVPGLQRLLHTTGLTAEQWGICIGLSALVFLVKKMPGFSKERNLPNESHSSVSPTHQP